MKMKEYNCQLGDYHKVYVINNDNYKIVISGYDKAYINVDIENKYKYTSLVIDLENEDFYNNKILLELLDFLYETEPYENMDYGNSFEQYKIKKYRKQKLNKIIEDEKNI